VSNILIIGGFLMKLGDGDRYWSLSQRFTDTGHEVRLRTCLQDHDSDRVTIDDLLWADVIVAYSYGVASTWELRKQNLDQIQAAGKRWKLWIVVTGVPDAMFGQLYPDLWHAQPEVGRTILFDVISVPVSCGLQSDHTTIHLGEPMPTDGDVQIDCNWLGLSHTTIKDDDRVLDAIFTAAGGQE